MAVFTPTKETIHVGRRAKPVPDYVTDAIESALKTHQAVTATLSPADAEEAISGFRRARRNDKDLRLRISKQADGDHVKILVEVSREQEPAPAKGKK